MSHAVRMVVGATTSGVFLVAYVLAMEMVGPQYRYGTLQLYSYSTGTVCRYVPHSADGGGSHNQWVFLVAYVLAMEMVGPQYRYGTPQLYSHSTGTLLYRLITATLCQ